MDRSTLKEDDGHIICANCKAEKDGPFWWVLSPKREVARPLCFDCMYDIVLKYLEQKEA